MKKFEILAIIGSASTSSSNQKLVEHFSAQVNEDFNISIFDGLQELPHFDPALTVDRVPATVVHFRKKIELADGVIICTPEYIFSIPSRLKNALEWCVATTVFSGKPLGIITASANGKKAHKELQLIMKTLMAVFNEDSMLLIQGIKGKISSQGILTDPTTANEFSAFIHSYQQLIRSTYHEY
ncbi:NAD(P)H-dependent oxidoreductase [Niabella yanshanensis]|uniref:NAD(P)H-dependent oxidoreductase n=1 Tax=Niabella yanshanensis TaxID=577386 RepID=A0ABZ0W728_9BACT|nr:NAD(P)H-dependent oxidoreductase [Niabella yanshanensis]WQD37825.1 NAD(P)H-dependent oxidoreductase [Niabella yanshanensis]